MNKKTAIVCGSSKGMGLAIAQKLASDGHNVLLVARNEELLKTASQAIKNDGGSAAFYIGDVTESDAAEKAVAACLSEWNQAPTILINNAGGPKAGTLKDLSDSDWDDAYQLSLMSFVRYTRAVIPHMEKENWGRIVNITSSVAKEPSPGMLLSAAYRAGVSSLTKAIAIEYAQKNITINTILPGGVLTERLHSLIKGQSKSTGKSVEELLKSSQESIPINRFADPSEVANVVSFLTSENASYVTGTSIAVDGGLTKSYF